MKNPKILAFYLPQFHEIPENNRWWGNGFTEWTSVKKAKPLFKKHNQPRIPLNDNYYNLLDKNTMKWQIKLAKEYGIEGFCYYHYWFKGKKLLEKPLELMLKDKELNIPFCLSWANESWSRTWYGQKKEILMKQEYGGEEDWTIHFDYLLNFFKDKRYIKINNKPILLIYKSYQINNLDKVLKHWNNLAIKNNFNGLYVIETLTPQQKEPNSRLSEGIVFYEPGYTLYNSSNFRKLKLKLKSKINGFLRSKYLLNRFNYDKIYKEILKRDVSFLKKKVYPGFFVDYDDTSRRGYQGLIFNGVTPRKFEKNLRKILEKTRKQKSEFLFLTAWNEWAEGAYLEPDKKNQYEFLKSIKNTQKKR